MANEQTERDERTTGHRSLKKRAAPRRRRSDRSCTGRQTVNRTLISESPIMKCSETLSHVERRPSRPFGVAFLLGFFTSCLWVPQAAFAVHPQIDITCNPTGSTPTPGSVPFVLSWDSCCGTGNSTWPNYVFVDLYDSLGAELPGYPVEDTTIYYSPTPSGTYNSEPDTAPGAVSQVISVSPEDTTATRVRGPASNSSFKIPGPTGSPIIQTTAIRAAASKPSLLSL